MKTITVDLELENIVAYMSIENLSELISVAQRRLDALRNVDLSAFEIALIGNGNVIDAIKALRARTGLTLRDAKDCVDFNRAQISTGTRQITRQINATLTEHEIALVQSNQTILAIKSVRARTGMLLKDAKVLVHNVRAEYLRQEREILK